MGADASKPKAGPQHSSTPKDDRRQTEIGAKIHLAPPTSATVAEPIAEEEDNGRTRTFAPGLPKPPPGLPPVIPHARPTGLPPVPVDSTRQSIADADQLQTPRLRYGASSYSAPAPAPVQTYNQIVNILETQGASAPAVAAPPGVAIPPLGLSLYSLGGQCLAHS